MMFDIAKAHDELAQKTIEQIHEETAYAWGERAIAAYQNYAATGAPKWLSDFASYKDEAVEHSALAGVYPQFMADFSSMLLSS
jgi:hypothetical protein